MGTDVLETAEALAAAEGAGDLLSRDNIPDENQSLTCFSCDTPMVGLYCHACGNKNDNFRRSVWSLAVEMASNLTAVDNRMWRTLWSLVRRPGQAAREFADGARTRWTSPVRFFLATSLLLFGYITLSGTQIVALGEVIDSDKPAAGLHAGSTSQEFLFLIRESDYVPPDDDAQARMANDFFRGIVDAQSEELTPRAAIALLDDQIEETTDPAARAEFQVQRDRLAAELGTTDADTPDPASGSDTDDINISLGGNDDSLTLSSASGLFRRIAANPRIINDELNDGLKLAMFFMMPFAMLMGAIFIRGRRTAMLYDHLVHAAYIHGVSFALLLVFILLHQFTSLPGLFFVYTAILLIYLPLSAKGMFRRGWFKSFLTAYGVGSVYTLIMAVVAITVVAGAVMEEARAQGLTGMPDTVEAVEDAGDTPNAPDDPDTD